MLNASHFRQRAAQARELAKSGDDARLTQMLLEVACDMDAEADLMEAEAPKSALASSAYGQHRQSVRQQADEAAR